MSNTTDLNDDYSDDYSDDYANDSDSDTGVAVLDDVELSPTTTDDWTGPRCEKCQAPLKSGVVTICRNCGWYASLGTFVELDPNWEMEAGETVPAAATEPASHLSVWINLIPRWGWVIIGSVFAVIVESVIARLATPAGSTLRTTWSLTQLAIGVVTVVGCHVFNFLSLAADDADIGLLDLLLKPLKLWTRTCQNLPKRLWFFDAVVCGAIATVMSLAVIGGIPYDRLWNWGVKEPPKQNLLGAVMDRAKKLDDNDDKSLEDAIGDFAGKGGIDGENAVKPEPPKPETKEKTDCVILGYQIDRDGRLTTLFLGTAHYKKLAFAGRVTPKLSDAEMNELLADLKMIVIKQPFISIPAEDTIWVQPKYSCRVTYDKQLKNGLLSEMKWDTMLGTMNTKR